MGFFSSLSGAVMDQTAPVILQQLRNYSSEDLKRIASDEQGQNVKRAIALYLLFRISRRYVVPIYEERKRMFENANHLLLNSKEFLRKASDFRDYIHFLDTNSRERY